MTWSAWLTIGAAPLAAIIYLVLFLCIKSGLMCVAPEFFLTRAFCRFAVRVTAEQLARRYADDGETKFEEKANHEWHYRAFGDFLVLLVCCSVFGSLWTSKTFSWSNFRHTPFFFFVVSAVLSGAALVIGLWIMYRDFHKHWVFIEKAQEETTLGVQSIQVSDAKIPLPVPPVEETTSGVQSPQVVSDAKIPLPVLPVTSPLDPSPVKASTKFPPSSEATNGQQPAYAGWNLQRLLKRRNSGPEANPSDKFPLPAYPPNKDDLMLRNDTEVRDNSVVPKAKTDDTLPPGYTATVDYSGNAPISCAVTEAGARLEAGPLSVDMLKELGTTDIGYDGNTLSIKHAEVKKAATYVRGKLTQRSEPITTDTSIAGDKINGAGTTESITAHFGHAPVGPPAQPNPHLDLASIVRDDGANLQHNAQTVVPGPAALPPHICLDINHSAQAPANAKLSAQSPLGALTSTKALDHEPPVASQSTEASGPPHVGVPKTAENVQPSTEASARRPPDTQKSTGASAHKPQVAPVLTAQGCPGTTLGVKKDSAAANAEQVVAARDSSSQTLAAAKPRDEHLGAGHQPQGRSNVSPNSASISGNRPSANLHPAQRPSHDPAKPDLPHGQSGPSRNLANPASKTVAAASTKSAPQKIPAATAQPRPHPPKSSQSAQTTTPPTHSGAPIHAKGHGHPGHGHK